MPTMRAPKRFATLAVVLLGATLALTACGSSDSDDSSDGGSEGYPVTVDTAYGEITLDEKPERVVALTATSVDILDSLGVEPTAYTVDAYENEQEVLERLPWLADLDTGEYSQKMVTAEFAAAPEAIAAHEPDLIIGAQYLIDDQTYEQLSKIAPTYVPAVGDDRDPMWDTLAEIGTLTGEVDAAEQVRSELEDEFAAAGDKLSGLQGKTYNYAQWVGTGLQFHAENWTLGQLGLVPGDSEHDSSGKPIQLSLENIEQLDADVLTIMGSDEDREMLEADPRFAELPAAKNEAVVWVDTPGHYASMVGVYGGPASVRETALTQVLSQLEESGLNESGS